MLRPFRAFVLAAMVGGIFLLADPCYPCSIVGCPDHGIELRGGFSVNVEHADRPLPGVTVSISSADGENAHGVFSGLTDKRGIVRVQSLSPGDYWIRAELLGVVAGMQCFHVSARPSPKARRNLTYSWGDLVPAVRQLAGKLMESLPGREGAPLWKLTHRVNIPVHNATLKLTNPFTGAIFSRATDQEGRFSFEAVPRATYVLHIEGGTGAKGSRYDPADLLIALSDSARGETLLLTRRTPGGGSCGGTYLDLENFKN